MDIYLGTIQAFGFPFAPRGWMLCSGQILAIQSNTALFSLLGTTYGGNGQTTFALPNLNGRTILGQGPSTTGTNYLIGEESGTENTTLLQSQMPAHTHGLMGTTATATTAEPGSGVMLAAANGSDPTSGDAVTVNVYSPGSPSTALAPTAIGVAGGNQPFNIMQPFVVVNYCIATQGIFPSRS